MTDMQSDIDLGGRTRTHKITFQLEEAATKISNEVVKRLMRAHFSLRGRNTLMHARIQ